MWEFLKVIWDIFVLRDAAQKGKLNWRKTGFVVGLVVLEYVIAMPALLLYTASPIQAIVHHRHGFSGCHSCRFCRSRVALAISVFSGLAGNRLVEIRTHMRSGALLIGEIL
jgi:hypothetical protein